MTCEDAAYDGSDADFQRWYFGGSPPDSGDWPRHAFEDTLQGVAPGFSTPHSDVRPARCEPREHT